MQKIKIVTDSTADLSEEIVRKYDIEVVPLTISIDGETFIDRVDITPSEFIKKMETSKELPKSSQPSPGSFLEVYNRLGKDGSHIISIHMTGGMSGTVRSAESAATMTDVKVTVLDSKFISKGLAFQVIEAAQMAEKGHPVEEIMDRLEKIKENTKLIIMVDTMENLVKGGRVGKVNAFLGSLLNIKPIASLVDGVLEPITKARSHNQVIKYMTKLFVEDFNTHHIIGAGIAQVEAIEAASKVKEAIIKNTGFKDISIDYTTPIISTHTGKGAFALIYYYE
ncbi:DegV family protein with EDD domain [Peribacillus deserti]|uniref:DegV family protein with EDD domain n=1 Tax=Peribacillus deserti TaxID=673318 RepID=A0ABS2QJ38_9BACI|nr:DegV family protein [Peribacillus deserti]MBM7692543.1 DegV family protein with EDD domain [Peribacillus deserti]